MDRGSDQLRAPANILGSSVGWNPTHLYAGKISLAMKEGSRNMNQSVQWNVIRVLKVALILGGDYFWEGLATQGMSILSLFIYIYIFIIIFPRIDFFYLFLYKYCFSTINVRVIKSWKSKGTNPSNAMFSK